jgi:hypothetical protein
MATLSHHLLGDKLHIDKRENSHYWQSSTYPAGKNFRVTKDKSVDHAKRKAEDWYLGLQLKIALAS